MCFKGSIIPSNRTKTNPNLLGTLLPVEQNKRIDQHDRSTSIYSNTKREKPLSPPLTADEIIIPSWTYSTNHGLIYHPIREKRLVKTARKSLQKKISEVISVSKSIPKESTGYPSPLIVQPKIHHLQVYSFCISDLETLFFCLEILISNS